MDTLMDTIKNSEEPEWLEKPVAGDLRLWQVLFLCFAGFTCLVIMVCCCFRFRIPRTKQQIEADYKRRMITAKFRLQLETIQDSKMDTISLTDALALLHERTQEKREGNQNRQDSQPSSMTSQQQSSLETSLPEARKEAHAPAQTSGSFAKFANKIATISKLGQVKPTYPTTKAEHIMDF